MRLPRRRVGYVVAIILLCLIALRSFAPREGNQPFDYQSAELHTVRRAVDGDTLLLTDGTRVRLIGVDTPESKHPDLPPQPLSFEAAEFTSDLVEGRQVRLEFDRERRDQYQRVLAYVWIDDVCLNEELIRAGYSRAETRFPYSSLMKGRFRAAEQQARDANRGLWAK